MANEQDTPLIKAVKQASSEWKAAFSSGNAKGCANQYDPDAVMHAPPFGPFTGNSEIESFWQKLIDDGFNSVEYINPKFETVDEQSALLTSGWKMNKASGVIHKELSVLQQDGTVRLREDDFEATG